MDFGYCKRWAGVVGWGFCVGVWVNPSIKKENLWQKSFLQIIWNEFLKICGKRYLHADGKANTSNIKKKICWLSLSIFRIFIRCTFSTWNTSLNNVKSSKKYPLLTADASDLLWHYYFHCTQFYLLWLFSIMVSQ